MIPQTYNICSENLESHSPEVEVELRPSKGAIASTITAADKHATGHGTS